MTDTKLTESVEKDIWTWITEFIEVNHEFYDYKFPPCPFAKRARLGGKVSIKPYDYTGVKKFIHLNSELSESDNFDIRVLAFPPRTKWYPLLNKFIEFRNKEIVPTDFYMQFGNAIQTNSRYPGIFNSGNYFIIIINRLSRILKGREILSSTNYYNSWPKFHYDDVVVRRQNAHDKYKNNNNLN